MKLINIIFISAFIFHIIPPLIQAEEPISQSTDNKVPWKAYTVIAHDLKLYEKTNKLRCYSYKYCSNYILFDCDKTLRDYWNEKHDALKNLLEEEQPDYEKVIELIEKTREELQDNNLFYLIVIHDLIDISIYKETRHLGFSIPNKHNYYKYCDGVLEGYCIRDYTNDFFYGVLYGPDKQLSALTLKRNLSQGATELLSSWRKNRHEDVIRILTLWKEYYLLISPQREKKITQKVKEYDNYEYPYEAAKPLPPGFYLGWPDSKFIKNPTIRQEHEKKVLDMTIVNYKLKMIENLKNENMIESIDLIVVDVVTSLYSNNKADLAELQKIFIITKLPKTLQNKILNEIQLDSR